MNKKYLPQVILSLLMLVLYTCSGKKLVSEVENGQNQILIIGVSHFNTFGKYGIENIDFYDQKNTEALNEINAAIATFGATRIFVEVDRGAQATLDSMYAEYRLESDVRKYDSELQLLAFSSGKRLGLSSITAVDIDAGMFPLEEILASLNKQDSTELSNTIRYFGDGHLAESNELIKDGGSIKDFLLHVNSAESDQKSNAINAKLISTGSLNNTLGLDVISDWYGKHLNIWAYVQKLSRRDEVNKVLLIYGSSHTAILKDIIKNNDDWKVVELRDIVAD